MNTINQAANDYAKERHGDEFSDPVFERDAHESISGFKAGANHIINSGDYIKRSDVVEAIEGMIAEIKGDKTNHELPNIKYFEYNLGYVKCCDRNIKSLTELLTKFKNEKI